MGCVARPEPVEDDAPGGSNGQTVDIIARRSGIKLHEVERVLSRLEKSSPPLTRRTVDKDGAVLWQLVDHEQELEQEKAVAGAAV